MKIGILEPSDFSESAISMLNSLGKVHLYKGEDISKFLKDKEVLFVRLAHDINASFLTKAKKLIFLCTPTTGLNHIDTDYCKRNAIEVISLKGEKKFLKSIRATPEHTLGLLLALHRNYKNAFLKQDNSVWDREPHKGFEVYGSKIGIVGFGRVGSIVASYLKALEAEIGYFDTDKDIKAKGVKKFKSIESLVDWSDSVLLTASYNPEQGVIMGKRELDLLKGKYFINTARAELTDETHLVKMASKGYFKGLAVDVITEEQNSRKHLDDLIRASAMHNIIITPHIAGATYSSMARTEEFISRKLLKLIGK